MSRYAYGTGAGPDEQTGIPTDEEGPEGCPDGWTPPEWDEVDR